MLSQNAASYQVIALVENHWHTHDLTYDIPSPRITYR